MKIFLFPLVIIGFTLSAFCQSKVMQSLEMESKLLKTAVKYSVYLSDSFDNTKETYPVVYLLNGYTGDETNWIEKGNLKDTPDMFIKSKRMTPMVIIMPDGEDDYI